MKHIFEIRAAEGGEDAELFSGDLAAAYVRFFDRRGWKCREITPLRLEVDGGDLRELSNEIGGHRIQRIPPTERNGRVHTSTVTVAITSADTVTDVKIDHADLHVVWFSGTGKGGQHRNKHQNCCRITHVPSGIVQVANGRERDANYREATASLTRRLNEIARADVAARENDDRQKQVGSGMRGDKRRTYRFRDDQVVDHLTGKSARCSDVMRGRFDLLW